MNPMFGKVIAVAGAAAALGFPPAMAAGPGADGAPAAESSDRYGTPAGDMPYDSEIRLRPNTRTVSVPRYDTIRFVTLDGREFRWRFDTLRLMDVFPLSHIAPAGVAVPAGAIVHVTAEIPIAP